MNAEHKKLNEANEGSAIFLEELDKVWYGMEWCDQMPIRAVSYRREQAVVYVHPGVLLLVVKVKVMVMVISHVDSSP